MQRGRGGSGFVKLSSHRRFEEIIRTVGRKTMERDVDGKEVRE
jgi:hypothetical protein